jgi:phosphoribosylglycinamide formyltransferase-1
MPETPGVMKARLLERFVSEPIEPLGGSFDTARMAVGGPGLPRAFAWRGETLEIATVVRTWRETGPCRHGSPEVYVRKHWFEVTTCAGAVLRLYFDRQPRGGRGAARWWLFSIRA